MKIYSWILCSLLFLLPYFDVSLYTLKPIFAYSYDTPKWIALFGVAVALILCKLLGQKRVALSYPRNILFPVTLYFLALIIVLIRAPLGNNETVIAESILFCVLVFIGAEVISADEGFLEKLDKSNLLSVFLVSLPVFVSAHLLGRRALPFFGSPTMFGEYLGQSLCIQLFALLYFERSRNALIGRLVLLSFSFYLFYLNAARAPLLGFIVAAIGLFFLKKSKFPKSLKIAFLAFVVILGSGAYYFVSKNEAKVASARIRIIRWKNTLELIKDSPLGGGAGNYAAAYQKYSNAKEFDVEANERTIIANPHNAYLELAAENGILALIAVLIFLLLSIYGLLGALSKNPLNASLAISLLSYWAVDALFNFPQDTPFGLFSMSLSFAVVLVVLGTKRFYLEGIFLKILGISLVLLLSFLPYKRYYSEYLSFTQMQNPEKADLACKLDPQNWRACLSFVNFQWERGEKEGALKLLDQLHSRFPDHFVIHKKIIQYLLVVGQGERACQELALYEQRFNNASSLHSLFLEKCH